MSTTLIDNDDLRSLISWAERAAGDHPLMAEHVMGVIDRVNTAHDMQNGSTRDQLIATMDEAQRRGIIKPVNVAPRGKHWAQVISFSGADDGDWVLVDD